MTDAEKFITSETAFLFSIPYDSSLLDADPCEYEDRAEALLQQYPWRDIWPIWSAYLYKQCTTAEAVKNYIFLFSMYGASQLPISEPLKFFGYIFYRLGQGRLDAHTLTLMDGMAVSVLSAAGYSYVLSPSYASENDAKILAAAAKWRDGKYN